MAEGKGWLGRAKRAAADILLRVFVYHLEVLVYTWAIATQEGWEWHERGKHAAKQEAPRAG